jgi:hypothetical protein
MVAQSGSLGCFQEFHALGRAAFEGEEMPYLAKKWRWKWPQQPHLSETLQQVEHFLLFEIVESRGQFALVKGCLRLQHGVDDRAREFMKFQHTVVDGVSAAHDQSELI